MPLARLSRELCRNPRVNHFSSATLEIRHITRGQGGTARPGDSGDLRVSLRNGSARLPALQCKNRKGLRRHAVEGQERPPKSSSNIPPISAASAVRRLPRGTMGSSTPPNRLKRARIEAARLPGRAGSRFRADCRMSRASSSIERPWTAAWTRRRDLSESSMLRIVILAVGDLVINDCRLGVWSQDVMVQH